MTKGKFITFEGGEGVGKTTQIRQLSKRLTAAGIDTIHSREPGGSAGAEAVRHVLLSGMAENMGMSPASEAILFAAARADHVDTTIRPAVQNGTWVLCDRFMDSTRVYQGEAENVPPELIDSLEKLAIDGMVPDLTFILDLRAEIGLERAHKRRPEGEEADRFERETVAVHEKRRQAFLKLAQRDPKRCKIIDASQTEDEIAFDIWKIIEQDLLNEKADEQSNGSAAPSNATSTKG